MKMKTAISTFLALALTTQAIQAATLINVTGAVSVNARPAASGAVISPGDRVATGDGAASVIYDNGCAVQVAPQQVHVVLYGSPSCSGASATQPDTSSNTLIIGGLAIGGAVGLAVALSGTSSRSNPTPVSP